MDFEKSLEGLVKLAITSFRLEEISLGSDEIVITCYRLGEMSGMFVEPGYNQV